MAMPGLSVGLGGAGAPAALPVAGIPTLAPPALAPAAATAAVPAAASSMLAAAVPTNSGLAVAVQQQQQQLVGVPVEGIPVGPGMVAAAGVVQVGVEHALECLSLLSLSSCVATSNAVGCTTTRKRDLCSLPILPS